MMIKLPMGVSICCFILSFFPPVFSPRFGSIDSPSLIYTSFPQLLCEEIWFLFTNFCHSAKFQWKSKTIIKLKYFGTFLSIHNNGAVRHAAKLVVLPHQITTDHSRPEKTFFICFLTQSPTIDYQHPLCTWQRCSSVCHSFFIFFLQFFELR